MANQSLHLQGDCIAPFLDAAKFPLDGGLIDGRFCAPIQSLPGSPTCCLPCPATQWTYSDSFNTYMTVAEWLNVVGLMLLSFMLLSYLVLPAQKTRSHYLSICLVVSVMMLAIGFTIPLSTQPEQCYNEITPNDMYSSSKCAWSGAFIIAGGLCADMWIFIRALSMNLQICWDIVPGKKFFYASQALGWGIPAVLFCATMTLTGVSFRFGRECDVNHANSMQDFWGPLMAFAGAAGILQIMTFAYCIRVYLKNLLTDDTDSSTNASSSGLPSYQGSVRTQTAKVVWRRLQKVLWLQWRGICIVTIILVDVVFFAIVFVWLDSLQSAVNKDYQKVEPWLLCLALHPDDKNACLSYVGDWLVNQPTVIAVLLLLSMAGFQCFLFLARPSLFPAWKQFFQEKFTSRSEFVSLDARRDRPRTSSKQELVNYHRGHESTTFELMQKPGQNVAVEIDSKGAFSPSETMVSSPSEAYRSPLQISRMSPSTGTDIRNSTSSSVVNGRLPHELNSHQTPNFEGPGSPPTPVVRYDSISMHRQNSDYFAAHQRFGTPNGASQRPPSSRSQNSERRYNPPTSSFSVPQAPSRQSSTRSVSFDPRDTYSRGGLALNPPSEAGESQEDLTGYHGPR
ncbi:uncharacterized protein LTR77_003582 [Saxophila tyrrhenica]|uniref:G-protein coupled receptors family 2 profile 2 domain-containing protein n=1 Tax=Saxophila tyrrhenica TaxID=1690608 RepID=A0AAV9PE23_9PEZI|nr:hypothetical protein LTR77_003582 [Saxophila tyrrhenica]